MLCTMFRCTPTAGVAVKMETMLSNRYFRLQSHYFFSTLASTPIRNQLTLGLAQIQVNTDKQANIESAQRAILLARDQGADMVLLPEMWNCPYSPASFPFYAEELPEPSSSGSIGEKAAPTVGALNKDTAPSASMLCETARATGMWIVGGSIPERVMVAATVPGVDQSTKDTESLPSAPDQLLYNTSIVVNPEGVIVAKHRKLHLFDINIPGKVVFRESDTLTAGNSITTVDTPWGRIGVGICYDMRFPELATVMRQRGCNMLLYPGAFNMTTGPLHWELLQRARAVDNNVFVATCSPARGAAAASVPLSPAAATTTTDSERQQTKQTQSSKSNNNNYSNNSGNNNNNNNSSSGSSSSSSGGSSSGGDSSDGDVRSRRRMRNSFVPYAHSSVVSPMGSVLLDLGEEEAVAVVKLDLHNETKTMSEQIPCWRQKRNDLYITASTRMT